MSYQEAMPEEPLRCDQTMQDIIPLKRSRSLPSCLVTEMTPTTTPTPNDQSRILPKLELRPVSDQDVIIAVMGATGVGKSSFINIATGGDHTTIGHKLHSCTREVQAISCRHPDGSGRNIVFVDTPGFDDTDTTDTDILRSIANWLTTTYERGIKLAGLVFLHRITDNRMAGTPLRNLSMFEKLCGPGALRNVILATTMWDEIDDLTGSEREKELRIQYWKSMIILGSQMARFYYTHESAWQIVDQFTGPCSPLQLQVEMVDEGKELPETAAGFALFQWLGELIVQFRQLLEKLEARLRGNPKGCDPEFAAKVIQEKITVKRSLDQANRQRKKLTGPPKRKRFAAVVRTIMTSASWPSNPLGRYRSNSSSSLPIPSSLESHQASSEGHSRVDDTRPEKRGRKLATIIFALRHIRDIVDMAPVPGLKGAVCLTLTIAESIESMNRNEHDLITLAQNAGRLVVAITDQVRDGQMPDDIRQTVEDLFEELMQVQVVIDKVTSRGRAYQYILQADDERVISACNDRIRFACHLFEVRSAIGIHKAVARMEARMVAQLNPQPLPATSNPLS